ncbi:ABC transporter substrate-binding protein [Hydrogenophaga sp.]|uniref:ABC transporter substrate-binding protein n=1 Tax=Hydrogenophaga sp. TaxID=1904254 RepID=UPI00271D6420|nr:ABC transporter substrate-binding protein [Hydrogenophaga sp.]MDO9434605.1 ABC transporter substrate-binding protein [Hydrogenophaga sp.]
MSSSSLTRLCRALGATALGALTLTATQAQEKFTFMTNWYAQAEHGGYYQAVATGIYKKYGLDVTIKMGGPQVNIIQIMAAGQADCIMGATDTQMMVARGNGLPIVNVAAIFQKDPQVLIAHEDVKSFEDMKGKTILIAPTAMRGMWSWLKGKYGYTDAQARPYTYNIQPFVADKNIVQMGFLSSEPFAIQKAGVKANTFLLADQGYPPYANLVSCMEKTVKEREKTVANFVKATAEGYKSYLADPAPANALIKKDNPNMTDDQLNYGVTKLKEMGIITSGDAAKQGIGTMTRERLLKTQAFLVENQMIDPAKVNIDQAYRLDIIQNAKVLP